MQFAAALQYLRRSGLINQLGIELELDGEALRCAMVIDAQHCGAPGIAHGGAVATLLDTALGARAMQHSMARGRATSTVEIKVNFLRPARVGQTLITQTRIESAGRSLLVVSGSARDAETDEPVAFAVGTFNLYVSETMKRPRAADDDA